MNFFVVFQAEPLSSSGSFITPNQFIHGYGGSIMLSSNTNVSNVMDRNEPCCFQLQPTSNLGSNAAAGLCVQGSADVNTNQSELSLSVPSQEDTPVYTAAVEPDSDETNQHLVSIGEFQAPQSSHASATEDGYSWRKYGQKLVKGSEFPRSYYKCTHPNCEVKKLFERAPSGEIAELMYKGMHDHPKPQPSRRMSTGPISLVEELYEKFSLAAGEEALPSQMDQHAYTSVTSEIPCTGGAKVVPDDVDADYDQFAKRRKVEIDKVDLNSMIRPIREPRLVVQTVSEVDILDDGYRWRKYGQKVVRGNPNPRSYYKCTSDACPVRKHVERAAQDPRAVITTYEGKHNHEVPIPRTSVHDTTTSPATMARPQDDETVRLNLGVGISSTVENAPVQHQPKDTDSVFDQNQIA